MRRALTLAEASVGQASPNPQVGCVLTQNDQVVGEGAHFYDLRDHAEIAALRQAGPQARNATAYVTLEPCSHHGRTGPCADALIAAGIARCFVATLDPNPAVSGRGLARLRAAGIEVHLGLEQVRARALNNAFAWSITRGRPFVTLKAGLSVDGRLAPLPAERLARAPHWLTGPQSRAEVQRMRHASDAILTGIGTVLADDPLLTDRSGLPRRRPLLRVVLDRNLRIPLDSKLVTTARNDLLLATGRAAEIPGASILELPPNAEMLPSLLKHLHHRGILSVLLEAGPTLNAAFLRADLVDQVALFYSATELGPNSLPFAQDGPTSFELEQRLLHVDKQTFGADIRVTGLLHNPWQA